MVALRCVILQVKYAGRFPVITGGRIGSSLTREVGGNGQRAKVEAHELERRTNLHDAFKASTAAQGKKMTDVLIQFIQEYVQKHPPQSLKRGQKE